MKNERTDQKSKQKWTTRTYWLSFFLFKLAYQYQNLTASNDRDQTIINGYTLTTRQLPPKNIKLLTKDILVLNLFDYTTHRALLENMTVAYQFKFLNNDSFYTFQENKNQPNLSHVVLYASKLTQKDQVNLSYTISATFNLNNKTKNDSKEYKMTIQLIDKDNVTKANFENFEEGFTFRMRSNDTNVIFPMNSDHIFGNDMNLTVRQINEESSKTPRIKVDIAPRSTIQNASFYEKSFRSKMVAGLGISLTSDVVIKQRLDKPSLFQVHFTSYDMFGNLHQLESPIFNDLEFIISMKINAYTHIATLNTENKEGYMLIFILKMSPRDPLPLTRLFYPDYKLVYYQIGPPIYDTSFSWRNVQVIWVFKLQKDTLGRGVSGDYFWEQKVVIFSIFIPDQSMRIKGEFSLAALKEQLDAKFDLDKRYTNITCTKIETFSRFRGMLGCQLLSSNSDQKGSKDESLEVFISIRMWKNNTGKFNFEVEDMMISINPQGKQVKAACLINFWQNEDSKSKEKHLIKPFRVVYYDEGSGYYMKSQTNEWIELIKESEIDQGFKLKNTMCHYSSEKLILEFQKELKIKRKVEQELIKRTWSKSVTYFINLNSAYRGNDRLFIKIEKDIAFDRNTNQFLRRLILKKAES